jgi:hypothetical protein
MTQVGLLNQPAYGDSTCPPGYRTTDIALDPTDRRDGPSRALGGYVRVALGAANHAARKSLSNLTWLMLVRTRGAVDAVEGLA